MTCPDCGREMRYTMAWLGYDRQFCERWTCAACNVERWQQAPRKRVRGVPVKVKGTVNDG